MFDMDFVGIGIGPDEENGCGDVLKWRRSIRRGCS